MSWTRIKSTFAIIIVFVFYLSMFQTVPATAASSIVTTTTYSNGYKFDPPVTITTMRFYGPFVRFQAGEDIDNNVWTKAYEDYCGIKLNSLFSVTDFTKYDLKVTTAIATDNLPDIMPLYTTLFFRVADSGRAADIKSVYDKYMDSSLKTLMEKYDGGKAYKTCYRNSILAGIASPSSKSPDMLWLRQDWLDKYGMSWPKTITQALKISKFFVKKNAGAPIASETFAFPMTAYLGEIKGLANAYGAYSNIWIDDGKGGIMRSDVSTKWKPVLKILNDMYEEGQLDPNFPLSGSSMIASGMTNQQYGMFFGGGSSPDSVLYNSVMKNSKARWKQRIIRDVNGNAARMQVNTKVMSFTSVSKKSLYPEAAIFLANIYGDLANGVGVNFRKYHDFIGKDKVTYNSFYYPVIAMSYPKLDTNLMISNALSSGDFSKLTGSQLGILDKIKSWVSKKTQSAWGNWAMFNEKGSFKTEKDILGKKWTYKDRGWGPEVQSWIENGPDLYNINTQLFVKIIRGDYTVEDGFNLWLKYFNANGGKTATTEMNEWWTSEGKSGF